MAQRRFPIRVPAVPTRPGQGSGASADYGRSDTPSWREVDWRAHQHRIEIGGTPVNYVDIGDGGDSRPIMFIHGLGGQWQNWLENIPRFAQSRRVIAADLPGFGASPLPRQDITIPYYAGLIGELADRLELGPMVAVGNSMGGYIAAELAITRPEQVERLMLVAAAGVSQMDLADRPLLAGAKAVALLTSINVARLRATAVRPRMRHAALQLVARHPTRLAADLAFEGFISGTGRKGFEPAMAACLRYDFRDRLPEIACPVTIVWGRNDVIIPVRDSRRYSELIAGARVVVFEDTGHVSMAERPVPFNDELQRFLDDEPVGSESGDDAVDAGVSGQAGP